MNEKFTQLEIVNSTQAGGDPSSSGGGSNKWFNVIVIVFILLVAGVFAMFQLGALSISDLVKKDPDDVMVFNTTESTESTSLATISTTSTGINGTTIGTTTTSRTTVETTTTSIPTVSDEIRTLYEKLKKGSWECNDSNLVCTNKEKYGEIYYIISFDLINLNFKLKNPEGSEDTYEFVYDFKTKTVSGVYNGTHLKYNSNQSFFVYDDQGNVVKGQPSAIATRTETYAGYYINKNDSLLASLVE
jgi:hypothetical protein